MNWSYENIEYNELDTVIKLCEQIIVSLGGMLVTELKDNETWFINKDKGRNNMIQTWDWLFLYLPRDEEKQKMVLENIESRECTEIRVRDFVLKFDFEHAYIYCACLENYEFKHKVIPGKVPFELVKVFLATRDLDMIDETKLELLI